MHYEALDKISYGLYVIGTGNGESTNGFIANTVFQISADPVIIAVSCSKNNHSHELINANASFSVSVLDEETPSETFSRFGYQSGADKMKFEDFPHKVLGSGNPAVVENCSAVLDCKMINKFDMGTHTLFIGEVLYSEVLENSSFPITYEYYKNVKKAKAPANAPTYQKNTKMKKPSDKCYECLVCGYLYKESEGDPDNGIEPGTKFEDLPEDYACPVCGAGVEDFEQEY